MWQCECWVLYLSDAYNSTGLWSLLFARLLAIIWKINLIRKPARRDRFSFWVGAMPCHESNNIAPSFNWLKILYYVQASKIQHSARRYLLSVRYLSQPRLSSRTQTRLKQYSREIVFRTLAESKWNQRSGISRSIVSKMNAFNWFGSSFRGPAPAMITLNLLNTYDYHIHIF